MSKEQNIKVYNAAYAYLKEITPLDVVLENYFIGDNRDFESLEDYICQVHHFSTKLSIHAECDQV